MKILIVDDDAQLLRALTVTLGARGYTLVTASDGRAGLDAVIAEHPDVILLDLGLPRLDGIGFLEGIRAWSPVPVLVLSGRTDSTEKVRALDAGADDYVTKPFEMDELLARLRALTRRTTPEPAAEPTITFGNIAVDLTAKQVTTANGRPIRLTPTEWRLLDALLTNPGKLLTREMLLTSVWGPAHSSNTNYLRLYMSQLRHKLETDPSNPKHLLTEAGMGYRFRPDRQRTNEHGRSARGNDEHQPRERRV